jgi:hypothetical protein
MVILQVSCRNFEDKEGERGRRRREEEEEEGGRRAPYHSILDSPLDASSTVSWKLHPLFTASFQLL